MFTPINQSKHSYFAAIIFALIFSISLNAQQSDNGSLTGTVSDQNGQVVVGASVEIVSVNTGSKRQATTNKEGRWNANALAAGSYEITVTATGFEVKKEIASVSVSVQTPVDIVLGVAGVQSESVTIVVDDSTSGVSTGSPGEIGSNISGRRIEQLPVTNRNAITSIQLNSSVSGDIGDPSGNSGGNPEVSVLGQRPTSVALAVDGIDATNLVGTGSLTENISPAPEFVQEVKLLVGNYDSSLGRTGGGNVQLVTRRGGQKLSGTAFAYVQNEVFNANDFFFNRDGIDRQQARRFEGGFSLGGQLIKERLFFFGGYQRTDAKTAYVATAQSYSVLPEALAFITDRTALGIRNGFGIARGDNPGGIPNPNTPGQGYFAPGCVRSQVYVPQIPVPSPPTLNICINTLSPFYRLLVTRNPITGDFVIPTLRPGYQPLYADPVNNLYFDDPIANGYPNGFPITDTGRESQFGGNNPLVRQRNASPAAFEQDQFITRFDLNVLKGDDQGNNINTLGATFFFANFPATEPFSDSTMVSPFPLVKNDRNRTLSLTDTHIFNDKLINEARFGYYSLDNSRELDARMLIPELTNTGLGIPNPASVFAPGAPSERCARQAGRGNLQDFSVCAPNDIFNRRKQITLTFANNVTYTSDPHTFRFGVEYKRNAFDTNLPEEQGVEFENNDNFGEQLVGYVSEADTAFGITDKQFRFNDLSFYVTDDWKVTSRLKLSLGVRWDWFGRPTEKNGQFSNFDPSLLTNPDDPRPGFLLPSNAGNTGFNAIDAALPTISSSGNKHTLNGQDLNNFAPRVGFSFAPFKNGRTVVSGGYGIFYDRPSASFINTVYSNYPYLREIEERNEGIPYASPFNLLFRNQSANRPISDYLPFRVDMVQAGGNGSPYFLFDNTQPTGFDFAEPLELRAVDRNLKTPLVQQWNLGIQHQFGADWAVEARYVGTKGQQLLLAVGLNQPYDLNDPNTPDYIFRRLNEAYVRGGSTQGQLRTGAASERQRGCGIAFGNSASGGSGSPPGGTGPQCTGLVGVALNYNIDVVGSFLGAPNEILAAELRVPYLGLDPTDSVMLQSRGYSQYHAGQLNVSRRLTKSYALNLSYTYSNSIDIGSTDPGSTSASGRPDTANLGLVVQGDQRNINTNRSRSDFDRRHRFAGSFIWELPYNKSNNKFLNGWQLSGFAQWQSGSPFSIFATDVEPIVFSDGSGLDGSFDGIYNIQALFRDPNRPGFNIPTRRIVFNVGRASGVLYDAAFGRPSVISLELLRQRNCSDITRCYFNTSQRSVPYTILRNGVSIVVPPDPNAALFAPGDGGFGNLGRNVLTGPSQKRFDISLQKSTKLSERISLELKWDIFNVFNLVNFANPNGDLTDETDFGQITRTVGAPRVMQFGAKLRF